MSVADILSSFGNWSVILNAVLAGPVLTTLVSILSLSMTVGFVLYLFKMA